MEGLSPVRFGTVSFTTNSLGPNDPKLGDTARVGNDQYVFVYNAGNSQIQPSYGAILSAVSGYSVTLSSVTSVALCVGVVKHATIATGYYGWLLTRGFCQVEMQTSNSATAGQLLCLAADGEFALKSNSTGYPSPACAVTQEAIASGASGTAYVSIW